MVPRGEVFFFTPPPSSPTPGAADDEWGHAGLLSQHSSTCRSHNDNIQKKPFSLDFFLKIIYSGFKLKLPLISAIVSISQFWTSVIKPHDLRKGRPSSHRSIDWATLRGCLHVSWADGGGGCPRGSQCFTVLTVTVGTVGTGMDVREDRG